MPSLDDVLASSALSGLRRITPGGGDRQVSAVRLAEDFADLEQAPPFSLVVLSRAISAGAGDYRLDMALRWAALGGVSAVAVFSGEPWHPAVTALDIARRGGIALVWIPAGTGLADVLQTVMREIGGSAERALGRAEQGLAAVLRAQEAGADLEGLCGAVSTALGTPVAFIPAANGSVPEVGASAPVMAGDALAGHFIAPEALGDFAVGARLVLHTAAAAAARLLDLARQARELPVRSRSELLAELLMSDAAISEDLLDRARQLGVPVSGWHVAVRIEADDLEDSGRDEVQRFDLLEQMGQLALQAAAAGGGTWYLSRIPRAIVLVRATSSNPGPQAGGRAARSAERALAAIRARVPDLRFRAGVGTPHEGPMGLRASAAEARGALLAARAARRPPGVAAHDAVGVRRMLMEWYSSDSARASVRDQLAPLERLGSSRAETAIQTLTVYLDEQGSISKTAHKLHLHRNAVANRLRHITELLDIDLDDPDQRLVLQLACRARLLS